MNITDAVSRADNLVSKYVFRFYKRLSVCGLTEVDCVMPMVLCMQV